MNFNNFNHEVAREIGDVEVYEDGRGSQVVHDDGHMHVEHEGKRYAYHIGQEVSPSKYNKMANSILKEIGVEGVKVEGVNN